MTALRPILLATIPIGIALVAIFSLSQSEAERQYGQVIHETLSDFSHIRIRERDSIRSLLFVDENGIEQCQSSIDRQAPHDLRLSYTRHFFASYLFHFPQERVLGGMAQGLAV